MQRLRVVCGVLLLLASVASASPVTPTPPKDKEVVDARGSISYVEAFKGGEKANVIVVGNNRSYLGLYIYDEHGNCVALDEGNGRARDDLAVEWYPVRTGRFTIEVRNFGALANKFSMATR